MKLLRGQIRDYAWGSRQVIAQLQGRPVPSPGPEAELWLGDHCGAPATVLGSGVPLPELLAADPEHWLGRPVLDRFGTRLPFLLKVLAADAPLSLQAHPDAEQARAGYAREQAAATAPAARSYVDPHHKPELLVALTPMDALCGFQDPVVAAELFAAVDLPALAPVVAALRQGPAGLAGVVRTLLTWPEDERTALVEAAVAAELGASSKLVGDLAERYPGDPGVLVALLLNHVTLAPGEAIWMPAGNLHAYLRGAGVEILAASDNVLRGGLTPKRVDVPELLNVLRFEVLHDPVLRAEPLAPGLVRWPAPIEDFALHGVSLAPGAPPVTIDTPGPRVLLCHAGRLTVDDGLETVTLSAGDAALGPAAGTALTIRGAGEAFVGTAGLW